MVFVVDGGSHKKTRWRAPFRGRPQTGAWDCIKRRNLLVGCVKAIVAGKKPPASTLYPAQRWDGSLSLTIGCSTRHWLDPSARTKSSLSLKTHGPPVRELVDKTADYTLYKWA